MTQRATLVRKSVNIHAAGRDTSRTTGAGPGGEGSSRRSAVQVPAAGSATWRALTAAAADVAATWDATEQGSPSATDVRAALGAMTDGICRATSGGRAEMARLPAFVPARRLLERLRRAFLDQCEAPDVRAESPDVVDVLRGFERVQDALDLDAAHRFASRLTGSDAQQLVVEMAHDMRSPLGSILILAERLRAGAGGEVAPIQQRQLGLIYSAAFGLSTLAGDVIELARGGTTLMDQQPMAFSVSDVLQSLLDILRPMAEEKRLTMRCTGPTADARVGHPAALNRVLLNLATNAIKFTNTGSVEVSCRELDRTRVEFSVRDTGRGIPSHVMANLFEAFRQRHAPGDYAFSSAGLGLSICQTLVGAMGAELGVETELEKGTRFHFVLDLPQPSRV
ncbi:MAG: HAMP domain-containing histidine kinase [Gemmatimonadetes bacterium]|nr:HAMP domain-containing histidine kinase [Gemmatimonadota bacterium]MCC6774610.1 HAMP domain-containing histidine kinase [Gemmatimonadaceae bacterium]